MKRKINFYAGPSTLPLTVLQQIQEEIVDYKGAGLSLIETSHRSKEYDEVHNDAITTIKELLLVPDNYQILFLGGGATLQFSMIPLNFISGRKECDFIVSGAWAKKAYSDAKKVGKVNVLFDGEKDSYTTLPDAGSIKVNPGSEYLHITSNETIGGIQFHEWPDTGNVPIISDMSSDMLSRPLPVKKFGLIYAGAQKNLGPAGVTLVIIRKDLLEKCPDSLTAYLNYSIHAAKNSIYNTPPVFSIYAMKLVVERIKKMGGLGEMQKVNERKASLLYDCIDDLKDFYNCPVDKKYRSKMNVIFRLPNEDLEKRFVEGSAGEGMLGLKGHRSVGGIRASIYNSMPEDGVESLVQYMKSFARKNG